MDPFTFIVLIILGILFAMLASMIGIGGGLLYTPTLDFLFGLETKDATYLSSFVIVFTSTTAFLNFKSQKRIDVKTAKLFLLYSIPGSLIGAIFADSIPREILRQLFGIIVGIASIRGILKAISSRKTENGNLVIEDGPDVEKRVIIDSDGKKHEYNVRMGFGKYFAFIGGLAGGFLGVGGGVIYMPIFTTYSGLPAHVAGATSTTMIVVGSTITVTIRTLSRIQNGTFDFDLLLSYGVPLAIGSVIGARYGSKKVKKMDSRNLLLIFWIIAFIAGMRMLFTPLF